MKTFVWAALTAVVLCFTSCNSGDLTESSTGTDGRDYFQLKIYRIDTSEQIPRLDAYFREAYLPALHRAGIEHVGVFKPVEGLNEELNFMMVLIPFKSLQEFEDLNALLVADATYQSDGTAYIDAPHDDPPYARIESILLRGFKAMPRYAIPDLDSPPADRIYELRSYEGATELLYDRKVEMFNDAGEVELFQKLEFNPVFFGEVLSSSHMPHLMYMTAFSDTTSQQEHWASFGAHPEWLEMRDLERYANTVSRITRYLMHPTEYSDF